MAQKLHIILDGAGYHSSYLVKDAAFVVKPDRTVFEGDERKIEECVYFKSKRDFKVAIDQFFTVTLPESASSLASRIKDNFQVVKPASSS